MRFNIGRTRRIAFLLAAAVHAALWLVPAGGTRPEPSETVEIAVVHLDGAASGLAMPGAPISGGSGAPDTPPVGKVPAITRHLPSHRAVDSHASLRSERGAELKPGLPAGPKESAPEPSPGSEGEKASAIPPSAGGPGADDPAEAKDPSGGPSGTEGLKAEAPEHDLPPESPAGLQGGGDPGGTGNPGVAGQPATGVSQAEAAAVEAYAVQALARLQSYHRYPLWAQKRKISGTVTLRLTIDRHGKLLSVKVDVTSGSQGLDKDAMETAQRAAPYPPFPKAIAQETVELIIRLTYRLEKE